MANDPSSYDTLLRIRRRQEDLKAGELAAAQRAVNALHEQRAQIVVAQQLALEQAQVTGGAQFDASEIRSYFQYERHLAKLRDDKDAELRAKQTAVDACRGEAEQAMKDRRIVEKLRERKRVAWLYARRRAEQQVMDEVATSYAARGIRPPGIAPSHVEEAKTS